MDGLAHRKAYLTHLRPGVSFIIRDNLNKHWDYGKQLDTRKIISDNYLTMPNFNGG